MFSKRLEELEPHVREKIAKACRGAEGVVTLRTRFELGTDVQRLLTRTIHKHVSEAANVSYEQGDEASGGIELSVGNQTVSWTIDNFLDDLERHLSRDLAAVIPHEDEGRTS
jgi:hypothetical protein